MGSWSRLLPYLWPYRRRVGLSLAVAGLVSALWSAELLLTFPLIKVFLQGQHLDQYVTGELQAAAQSQAEARSGLLLAEAKLAALPVDADDGVALELLREKARQQRRLNSHAWQLWTMSWLDAVVVPYLPRDQLRLLATMVGVLLLVTALKGACVFAQDVLSASASERAVADVRMQLYRRLLQLDPLSVAATGEAPLSSRFAYDLQAAGFGLQTLVGKAVREPLKAAGCLIAALMLSWQLTCLSLLFAPVAGWLFHTLGRRLRRAARRALDRLADVYSQLSEALQAAKLVAVYGTAADHRRRFHRANRAYLRQATSIVRIDAACGPVMEILAMLAVMAALLPAAYLVLRKETHLWSMRLSATELDIAELSVMYTLLAGMFDPLRKLSKLFGVIKHAGTAAERVFEQMDRDSLVAEPACAQLIGRSTGEIEFEAVTFHYPQIEGKTEPAPPVLVDFQWRIDPGERVAIVGENGCGKSTLIQLLLRFSDPTRGVVRIDGNDARQLRLRDLRRQMAWAPQESLLLAGSIADNIRYGRPDAADAELLAAAEAAHVLDFARDWPEGLSTPCGEGGRELSGGQRQRIALARAYLRNPPILLLDEPTAAVDPHSEQLIWRSLAKFVPGRTMLLVTHTLSDQLLELITKVAVVDRGRLVAYGTHADVLATCPIYQRLFHTRALDRAA